MCGILGVLGFHPDTDRVKRSLVALASRGPDGEGVWQNSGEPPVTLGHRRLSILDLSNAGDQPMARECHVIAFNGEIYNFHELRAELEALGHVFKTQSDTEVLLAAWAQWDEKCVERLNGMWSFAIWDKTKRVLTLCRDRFGKKPLFYAFEQGGLIFASEMKALAPLMREFRPSERFQWCAAHQYEYESTTDSLIEGIFRFPAGSVATIDSTSLRNRRLKVRRYWDTQQNLVSVPERYEEQVEIFRELFIDACRLRLRSDVPIGTCLSGGLDSSAVVCGISEMDRKSRQANQKMVSQHAFVATFSGSSLDETPFARAVIDKTGIDSSFLEISAVTGLERLERYTYQFEELYPTNPISMMDLYAKVAESGVRVSIDGHGGDELLSGYSEFLCAMNDAFPNLTQLKRVLRCMGYESPGLGEILAEFRTLHHGRRGLLKFLFDRLLKRGMPEHGYLHEALYSQFHRTMLPTLLRNYDRYSMSAGVEIRMPFLDYRLVQFCFSLPWTSKVPERTPYMKGILRDALADNLPNEVRFRRDKIGFSSPIGDWLRGPWRPWLQDLLASRAFRECELLDATEVSSMFQQILSEERSHSFCERAWSRLNPFLWQEFFLKRCQENAK